MCFGKTSSAATLWTFPVSAAAAAAGRDGLLHAGLLHVNLHADLLHVDLH